MWFDRQAFLRGLEDGLLMHSRWIIPWLYVVAALLIADAIWRLLGGE